MIEGAETRSDMATPITFFAPSVAPSGATSIRGTAIPAFRNHLFVATLQGHGAAARDDRWSTSRHVAYTERLIERRFGRLRDVLTGPDGFLYICTSNRDGRTTPVAEDDRLLRKYRSL